MLELRQDLIISRLRGSGRSIAAIAASWPNEAAPHRSTLLRWLKSPVLPRSARQLLGLAGALDLDPFALWAFAPDTFDILCARVIRASRSRRWAMLHPALSFLADFIGPVDTWPHPEIAEEYYHRSWCTADFEHTAGRQRNFYAALAIRPPPKNQFADPQVWHFAWRDAAVRGAAWRPYGFVEVLGSVVRLFNFSGLVDIVERPREAGPLFVETWFGEGAAKFRVASLHKFTLRVQSRKIPPAAPRVRFALPGPAGQTTGWSRG